ncbi:MarR family winged helix-turn-helix transcriptional regulator [Methylophilus medardicus]|uniref:MarR family transcriptional regulator n=1 Tax=Methylophilus medardicus TaxID=2588534 RepID=A0A5B8CQK8_9PROT|nr:MarR family transcriptional regulator [Methylophilus medardicus]QDC43522.1 MarR family transcriptional regulator [Methylophilus medardicus]QDC48529.1 MarR family transcriptional regulator [Methylophilus medardicus]QDC52234.1 MarR family transcriptional regulator [Methylophilus medardicus]
MTNLYLENQLCFSLYSATHALLRSYKPDLDKFNLTYPQYLVLVALWQYKQLSIKQIAEKLMLEPATITPVVKRLEVKKLTKRTRQKDDERVVIVSLTEEGLALRDKLSEVQKRVACDTGLTNTAFDSLNQTLGTLTKNVTAKIPD